MTGDVPAGRAVEALREMIRQVSDLDLDADQGFFEAGLTSAQLVSVHELAQQRFDRSFAIALFFKHITCRSLAVHLARVSAGAMDPTPPAAVDGRTGEWTPDTRRALRARLRTGRTR